MDRTEKNRLWKKRMEDFEASGQTIHEWVASQEDITVYQFHYWRKKFKLAESSQPSSSIETGWTSLEVPVIASSATIEVRLNDLSIHIPENVSEDHLHRVLSVLRNG